MKIDIYSEEASERIKEQTGMMIVGVDREVGKLIWAKPAPEPTDIPPVEVYEDEANRHE